MCNNYAHADHTKLPTSSYNPDDEWITEESRGPDSDGDGFADNEDTCPEPAGY